MRKRRLALAGLAMLLTSGCTPLDNMLASVPFFAFLRESPSLDPYEAPRAMPPNSVPFSSPNGDEALPPLGPSEAELQAYAAGPYGVNPLPHDSAVVALGAVMYERYCFVCHGMEGTGGGPIVGPDKYPNLAPNLTLPLTVGRSDGYIYAVIRAGRGLMPAYGPRLSNEERWAVVHYVRELQRRAGSAPAAAPAAQDTAQGNP